MYSWKTDVALVGSLNGITAFIIPGTGTVASGAPMKGQITKYSGMRT
jgi:hypothetical protein